MNLRESQREAVAVIERSAEDGDRIASVFREIGGCDAHVYAAPSPEGIAALRPVLAVIGPSHDASLAGARATALRQAGCPASLAYVTADETAPASEAASPASWLDSFRLADLDAVRAGYLLRLAQLEREAADRECVIEAILGMAEEEIYVKDRHSRFRLASQSLAPLFGAERPGDIYGKSDDDFFGAEWASRLRGGERSIIETGQGFETVDHISVLRPGRWVRVRKGPLRDRAGHILGVIGVNRVVTEAQRTERLWRIQRDLGLRLSAISTLPEAVDAILDCAAAACEGAACCLHFAGEEGLDLYQARGFTQEMLDAARHVPFSVAPLQGVLSGKPLYRLSLSETDPYYGELSRAGFHAYALLPLMREGAVRGLLGLAVTRGESLPPEVRGALEAVASQAGSALARIQAAERKEMRVAHLERALGAMADSVAVVWEHDGQVDYANPAFVALCGGKLPDGANINALCRAAGGGSALDALQAAASGHAPRARVCFDAAGGPVHAEATARFAGAEDSRRIVGVFRPLSQETLTREREAQRVAVMRELGRELADDFAGLLSVIIGNASLALPEQRPGSGSAMRIETALNAARRGKETLSQLAAFAQPASEASPPLALETVLTQALAAYADRHPEGPRIAPRLGPGLWPVRARARSAADLLIALCDYVAQEATAQSGRLALSLHNVDAGNPRGDDHPGGRCVRIRACLAPEQAAGATPLTGGPAEPNRTVLAKVRARAHALGGAMRVASGEDGSCVTVYLPALPAEGGSPAEAPTGRGERVLLIEQEAVLRKVAAAFLQELGYEASVYAGPAEALEALRADPEGFDALLAGHAGPDAGVSRLAAEALKIRPGLHVLVTRGRDVVLTEEDKLFGLTRVLRRPYTREDLANALREALA